MSLSSSDSSGNESSPPRNFAKQQTEPIRKKKGAQSIDYHFTDAQERHLSTLMSSFEKQVNKLDPEWRGHCAPLTVWKKNTIHMLMQHELFRDLVKNGSLPQTKWFQVRYLSVIHCAIVYDIYDRSFNASSQTTSIIL